MAPWHSGNKILSIYFLENPSHHFESLFYCENDNLQSVTSFKTISINDMTLDTSLDL